MKKKNFKRKNTNFENDWRGEYFVTSKTIKIV